MREARVWLKERSGLDASLQWAVMTCNSTRNYHHGCKVILGWQHVVVLFLCLVAVGHLAKVTSALLTSLSKLYWLYQDITPTELCGWKALKYDTYYQITVEGVGEGKPSGSWRSPSFFCGREEWKLLALLDCCPPSPVYRIQRSSEEDLRIMWYDSWGKRRG